MRRQQNQQPHQSRTSGIVAPIPYIGGKSKLAKKIIDLLPVDRDCYVEVFGGAGHVITQKAREQNEVYNDVQGIVVNFFLVLKEHTDELLRRVERMPHSREEHARILRWWRDGCPGPVTDIERAARWYYLLRTSFSSLIGNPFGYGRGAHVGQRTFALARSIDRLRVLADRWRTVEIEQLDFSDLINRYDTAGTVFYLDPPYVGVEDYYEGSGFTADDHARLAECANSMRGRAIISYYPHGDVDALYPKSAWKRIRYGAVKASFIIQRDQPKERPRSTELLLLNFDPKTGKRLRKRRKP